MATLTFNITALDQASRAFDKIGDKVDALAAKLRALDGIRAKPTVKVDIDDGGLALLRQRLNSLPNKRIKVDVDIDQASIQALRALSSRTVKIQVKLDGAAAVLTQLAALTTAVNQLDGRTIRIRLDVDGLAGALAQLTALAAALATIGRFGGGGSGGGLFGGGITGVIATVVKALGGLVLMLAKASAYATALAVAGAAVTAAFGAASTAVATLPGLLALMIAPMAAISLGSEAIGKAFKGIGDQLRADVGRTWAAELEPIVTRLAKNVMPDLTARLKDTVIALTDVGEAMTGVVENISKTGQLKEIFDRVNGALRGMTPGLTALTSALGDIAARRGAFDPLVTAVDQFGLAFKRNITDLINSGALDRAFQGLADTAGIAARGLADLVANGIEAFSTAAPGFNAALESVFGFLNRFDWSKLGAAAGDVLQGIADTLNGIDQSTIDAITAAFQRLGDAFNSPAFQQNIQNFIAAIPVLIDALTALVGVFSAVAGAVGGFLQILSGVGQAVTALGQLLRGEISFEEFGAKLLLAAADVATGIDQIKTAFKSLEQIKIDIDARQAQRSLQELAKALVATPDKKSIVVELKDPSVIAQLEAIGIKVTELPDGKVKLELDDAQFQAKLKAALALGLKGSELLWYLGLNTDEFQQKLDAAKQQAQMNPIRPVLDLDTGPYDGKLADAYARASQALPMPQLNLDPAPALVQIGTVRTAILGLNSLSTTATHTQTHNIPVVISAIQTLNQQRTTAPHVQTHNVPVVISAIQTLNRQNTTSKHVVSHNVPAVISAINSLNGRNTSSTHTITTVHKSVGGAASNLRASGGAVVRMAGGGILGGYAPGRDTIPALLSPGESVLTPEATRLLGGRAIMALNRMTSGRRGTVAGQGAIPGGGRADARGFAGSGLGGDAGRVERKLDELIGVLRNRDGVTVNVAGSPVGDPTETAQAVKLALRTS